VTRAIDQSSKLRTYFVEFRYGQPVVFERFTNSLEDESFGPGTFISLPAISFELPKNVGTLEAQRTKITVPIYYPDETTVDFAVDIASGEAFYARTRFQIWELDRGLTASETASQFTWIGLVQTSYRNFQGSKHRVVIEGLSHKFLLDAETGIRASDCQHRLGDLGCAAVVPADTITVTAINGKTVTTTAPPVQTVDMYRRGYMQRLGVRIGIRDWDKNFPTTFHLLRRPPNAWLNQTVQALGGCTKLIDRCREWGREESFLAPGVAMPAYHPVFETP